MNYYHPTTLEHIRNPLPAVAEWATATAITAPEYDSASQQCRCIDGAWAVTSEDMAAQEADRIATARIAEIKTELVTIDQKRIRPLAEGDTAYLSTLNSQVVSLRAELNTLLA